jgi:hypothetical protein
MNHIWNEWHEQSEWLRRHGVSSSDIWRAENVEDLLAMREVVEEQEREERRREEIAEMNREALRDEILAEQRRCERMGQHS